MIISASRRCDIPAYFGEWFINCLSRGDVLIQNPYNQNRLSRAILTPQTVDIIVFWTKNPLPFFEHLPRLDNMGYPYYFQFTLTPYGRETERNLPDKEILLQAFSELSKRLGKHRVVWRYDPIIIDDNYDISYHEEQFSYMAKRLCGATNRCVISFVDSYQNVITRMGRAPKYDMSLSNIHKISEVFSGIAGQNQMELFTCAEQYHLDKYGVHHGACIDQNIIRDILGVGVADIRDKNQRPECRCLDSIDIGTYNCCANGCVYCYAVKNDASAAMNIKKHDPKSPMLIGHPHTAAIITDRASKSIKIYQTSLFD